jgi:Uncharacterized protein conserved in bacteria
MNEQDRKAIETVFNKLRKIEREGLPRDAEAEQFIEREMRNQPGSAYYLAQTVLIQQEALKNAQVRIQELEKAAAAGARTAPASNPAHSASLSTGFGRSGSSTGFGRQTGANEPARAGLTGPNVGRDRTASAGGGFLAGALQTAMGVAGGMMLGNMLSSFFGGNDSHASEAPTNESAATDSLGPEPHEDASYDETDDGFDLGGDDGFDI